MNGPVEGSDERIALVAVEPASCLELSREMEILWSVDDGRE